LEEALNILRVAFADRGGDIKGAISEGIELLRCVPVGGDPKPLVGIVGEIYIRCNAFSNEDIVRTIELLGGEAWLSPTSEWILYTSYLQVFNAREKSLGLRALIGANLKKHFLQRDEHRLYEMAGELLKDRHEPSIEQIISEGERYIPIEFRGESILTIGRAIIFARQGASLVVDCEPFTCMHGTISDAIFQEVSQTIGIPIVNMAYDGEGGQNSRLEVFFANREGADVSV
jgi:predicted nucleotide-binding protein (sugar kinase/HSP70/actin superfamily)